MRISALNKLRIASENSSDQDWKCNPIWEFGWHPTSYEQPIRHYFSDEDIMFLISTSREIKTYMKIARNVKNKKFKQAFQLVEKMESDND